MSRRVQMSVAMLVACSKPPSSPPPAHPISRTATAPVESVPREVVQLGGDRELPNIVITAGGVYFGGQKLDRIGDALARAHQAQPMKKVVVFALASAPVQAIVETIQGVQQAGWVRAELNTVDGDRKQLMCDANWEDPRPDPKETVMLSIELTHDRTWVGLSRVNEFQELPARGGEHDFEKLEMTLREHRASAFFADRRDAQLAFDPDITTAVALRAIATTCNADFNGLLLVSPGELAARVQ